MPLTVTALSVDAIDPLTLATFWAAALRWEVREERDGIVSLRPTDGTRFTLPFIPTPGDEKREKNRIHLDLTTVSIEDQQDTVRQLLALGARHIDVGQGANAPHVVLADPEGNEFCVIEPENQFLSTAGRFGSVTCDGTRAVGLFWSAALGWSLVWDQDEETAIRDPDGTGPFITWGGHTKPKVMRNRLHLELAVTGAGAIDAELERLLALGAQRVRNDALGREVVAMRDPDGNEFFVNVSHL